jgi:hypothetical protein
MLHYRLTDLSGNRISLVEYFIYPARAFVFQFLSQICSNGFINTAQDWTQG